MGNLCCFTRRRAAANNNFTASELDDISHQLELFFERVPRTPLGTLDVKHCEREAVRDAVDQAKRYQAKRYDEAFAAYALRSCVRSCVTLPVAEVFRETCATLTKKYSDPALRCKLPHNSDVNLLLKLASENGDALHAALRKHILKGGGAYLPGPRKTKQRIEAKAKAKYDGDVARVIDVERATGVFDSLDALNSMLLELHRLASDELLAVRRFKDAFFEHKQDSGYRDIKVFVEVSGGFIGELQLTLRRIVQIKGVAHKIYKVERALVPSLDEAALRQAIVGLDIESEQVLRLVADGPSSVLDAFGSVDALEKALTKALPPGCEVANVYVGTHANVSLGVTDAKALAALRDDVVLGSSFEDALNHQIPSGRIRVDRGTFMECYARAMMRFTRLTMHQREKLKAVRSASVAVLMAPAGGGKTFVAIQRFVDVLNEDPDAMVLFVARNEALALLVCKWLVVASRKSAEHVVARVHVLVAPFSNGPRCMRVETAGGLRRLVFGDSRADEFMWLKKNVGIPSASTSTHAKHDTGLKFWEISAMKYKYKLIVVDEAHHLVGDSSLRSELAELGAAEASLLFLGDASQAVAAMPSPDNIAHSLVDLPKKRRVAVATLSEVVRSTKRVVAGAAAFQLEAGRKAKTSTHGASAGPPLVARIFNLSEEDDTGEVYAREVVEALAAIRRQLVDLEDLDDRVAVMGPDEVFIERLRKPLACALGGFELVDAATASAVLPRSATEARDGSKQWLVVDTVDNMDGLERLVVICVGLDHVIDRGAGVLETRSRLYRAMTRAQLAVAVVNEALPGGWLEFLGRLELGNDKIFEDYAERWANKHAETAADDVVNVVDVSLNVRNAAVAKASVEAPGAVDEPVVRGTGATDIVVDADATTPSEAEPMKLLQSIWDASAVATASRGDPLFMPFFDLDPSKLAEIQTLRGQSEWVWSVAAFPDGQRIVSGGGFRDNMVRVWDLTTGKCVATLKGHSLRVKSVAVFPNGRRVVSTSWDNTLKVWNVETGKCVATLQGHNHTVSCVAIFPDGSRVVSGSWDKTLKVWDAATGRCIATLEGHSGDVYGVAVSPDERRVLSVARDNTLKVWDVVTGECVATLEGHSNTVSCVAIFPDGRRVVSGSDDKTLKVWDMATKKCLATLQGHSNTVTSVAVSPTGRRVVSASRDNTVRVWNVATGACLATLKGHSGDVQCVAVFPDGRRIVSASYDGTLKVWGVPFSRTEWRRRRFPKAGETPAPRARSFRDIVAAAVPPSPAARNLARFFSSSPPSSPSSPSSV